MNRSTLFGCKSISAVLLMSGLLAAPAIASASEATFDRTLTVSGNVNLYVATGSGYVHVSPGSDNQIHIVGHVKSNNGWFGGSSEDRVKQVAANPPIEQSGNEVHVGKQENSDWLRNISIDYEITTPRGSNVSAGSGSGDLEISGIGGGLKASTGSGSIGAHGIGGAVALDTGSGDIKAELNNPNSTKAQTGSGSIRINGVIGGLKAGTGSGDIEIQGQPTSDWKLETGSGSVTLTTGGSHFSLDASTGSGSVHSDPPITTHGSLEKHHVMGDINGGGPTVRVETGSGDIRIK
jgi:Putative adhesin